MLIFLGNHRLANQAARQDSAVVIRDVLIAKFKKDTVSIGEIDMAEKNTANIGFEKKIWEAACVLRGNLDASEYKSVVLGLIFLKYISSDKVDIFFNA